MNRRWAWIATAIFVLFLPAACRPSRGALTGAFEARFVAIHNAFSAIGLAQIGPIQQGSIAEGREARVNLTLPVGCVAIVAMGGDGIVDLNATLLDPQGVAFAHDTTAEPQAVLRPCLSSAGPMTLVIKAAAGQGTWIVAAWAGGLGGHTTTETAPAAESEAHGTCAAPIPLEAGTVSGSTKHGEHENTGSCEGPSDSRELVYELDVARRERVTIDLEATFDSVLYIRKDDCSDSNAEVDCNDDAADRLHSRIDRVVDPGKYFVFVDGYGHEVGAFKMTVSATELLGLSDACRRAPLLADGVVQQSTTAGAEDDARATCGGGAEGADAPWRAELTSRARVRIVEHSDDIAPIVHARHACNDPLSELACGETGGATGDAVVTGVFEPGAYTVFADAHERDSVGRYSLLWETDPPTGSGTTGDACGDAIKLSPSAGGLRHGDTFAAHDDVAGTCGGAGAADVIYRLDVPRRSRLVASLDSEDAPHVLVAWRRCADPSAEVACGRAIDEVVAPGTYYLAVDGTSPDALGRFAIHWALDDLGPQSVACAKVPNLAVGRSVHDTTSGAGDHFTSACVTGASGPDRVYKFALAARTSVRLAVQAPSFDPVVTLRKACEDAETGPAPDLTCESDVSAAHELKLEQTLEPGTYWVVVDGQTPNDSGPFTLDLQIKR